MWRRVAVAGVSAAIIGLAGTAAIAASGTDSPTPSASPSGAAPGASGHGPKAGAGKHAENDRLRGAVHATWVSEDKKTSTFTTHDAIRGQVAAVSPTSITVEAADHVTETYIIGSDVKVSTRSNKTTATISDVTTGDPVWVVGTGTTTRTATRVVDAKK